MLPDPADARLMRRCFELARAAVGRRELPFGSVVARDGVELSGEANGVREARDVTRHAEVCAIVSAQQRLGRASLEGCTLYTNVEPCAFCSYAIREARIARVVFALASPVMGGASRWDVLQDPGLSRELPEVFAPAPEVVAGYMAEEARTVCLRRRGEAQSALIAPRQFPWRTLCKRHGYSAPQIFRSIQPGNRVNGGRS
jgi:tRNA(adenine34) deaminase